MSGWSGAGWAAMAGLAVLAAGPPARAAGEGPADRVRQANQLYDRGDLDGALQLYTDAQVEVPESPVLYYNIGNVLYRRGEYGPAVEEYRRAAVAEDPDLARAARFNIGNAHFQAGEYEKAVQDFQDVLLTDPGDVGAKRNLELALQRLPEEPPPQQQERQKGSEQEREEQSEPPSSQGSEDPQPQGGEEQSQEQGQQPPPQGQDPAQQPPQGGAGEDPAGQQQEGGERPPPDGRPWEEPLPAEEAARILDALKQQEKENMKNALRAPRTGKGTGKDW